ERIHPDEPYAGFDPRAGRDCQYLVHATAHEEDTPLLLNTHDLDEAEKLADRILMLADGRIVADGSPEALARELGSDAEVRWRVGGERFVHSTPDGTGCVRGLVEQHGEGVIDR